MTSFDAALKSHYTSDTVENLVYTDNPLLALMPKYENFGGKNLPIPIIYGNPQGRSATFSTAQTGAGNTSTLVTDFVLTRINDYSIARITGEAIAASQGDANAFMEAATTEIDGALSNLTNTLARDMYRNGWGKVGVVGSSSSGSTMYLATPEDVDNFEVGMVCTFSSSESAATLRNSGTGLTVSAVDRDAGTVTFSGTLSSESVSVGDTVFAKGDRQNSATPSRLKVAGLEAWLPTSAPDSTAFFGVDRSADVTRLAGVRYSPTAGTPIDQILIKGASLVGRQGGRLSHYFMSYATYNDLVNTLGSKVQYVNVPATATVGFTAVEVVGPRGTIKCIADRNCPGNRVYGLDMSVWKLYSAGKAIRTIDDDDMSMLRQSDADGVEVRLVSRSQVGCRAPGRNVVITLP